MTTRQQRKVGLTSLGLLALTFIAALIAANTLLRGMRIDLTENNLYTISAGTRDLLQTIDEPINLYFFFSDQETADVPYLRGYATRVRETLEEFARVADGGLIVHVIDPAPLTCMYPSSTFQAPFHSLRSVPSKRMIASEGAPAAWPGVTIRGWGRVPSCTRQDEFGNFGVSS